METIFYFVGFVVVALSSYLIGKNFTRLKLPYITGYLFAGALVGPFMLGFLPAEAVGELRFVDQLSLAIIAFVAGSELFIKELRNRLRSILYTTTGIVILALTLGGISIFFLTEFLSFTAGRPFTDRFAVALLGATVLLALSPPSTIAVIKEVRARGDFTRTILSVTVFMDVVIIVLFSITTSIASVLLMGTQFDISFILLLGVDLAMAITIGGITGKILELLLASHLNKLFKTGLVLLIGYIVYFLADEVKYYSPTLVGFEVYLEPLLACLIAGFMITNFTDHRDEFDEILHDIGPMIYVAFFTLTGISLKLDILLQTLPFAMALFFVRMGSIYTGSYVGSKLAGETPMFQKFAGLALITQAGIALGLSREVAVQFPTLGTAFATLIISVIVLNEIFGPMLLKEALKRAGEANLPKEYGEKEQVRDALILGIETQSLALARELKTHDWRVIMADTDKSHVEDLSVEDVDERHVEAINEETLSRLIDKNTDAVVAMLDNDTDNLRACKFARHKFDVPRLVVRLNNVANSDQFTELDVLVVDPASAMINLLEQSVLAPQSAALMLHKDPNHYEVVQRTVTNKDVDGVLVRDLRLPSDVLILGVTRNGHSILPSGYMHIHLKDDITLVGKPDSLQEVTMRLGY